MKSLPERRERYDKGAPVSARAALEIIAVLCRREIWNEPERIRVLRTVLAYFQINPEDVK